MTTYLVTLSFLIFTVLLIRMLFRRTVSPRLIYALWLVVVVKLCMPVSFFFVDVSLPLMDSAIGIKTDATETEPPAEVIFPDTADVTGVVTPVTPTVPPVSADTAAPVTPPITDAAVPSPASAPMDVRKLLTAGWIAGSAVLAVWFAVFGGVFYHRLRVSRKLSKTIGKTKVYVTPAAGVPCLFGLVPAIYLTPEAAAGSSQSLILTHEYTHLCHGDHIWAAVRMLALIFLWWNPLVWVAAILSKRDSELACDDSVAAKLNEKNRLLYAHVLLDTASPKYRYAVGLGSAPMKERIRMLANKQKNRWLSVLLAIALTVSAAGCSFIGVKNEDEPNSGEEQENRNPLAEEYPDLTRLFSLTVSELRQEYGAMTLAYSEHGPGQPVYSIEEYPGVHLVFYNWNMDDPLNDGMMPDELILTKAYDGAVMDLAVGRNIEDTSETPAWDKAEYHLIEGTVFLDALFDPYTLTAVVSGWGLSMPEDTAPQSEWDAWYEAYRQSPAGEIVQLRLKYAKEETPPSSTDPSAGNVSNAESIDIYMEDTEEYLLYAASYGIVSGASYTYFDQNEKHYVTKIGAGSDGWRYDVFGMQSDYRRVGNFSGYKTYLVQSEGGYIASVEETDTFTKEAIWQNGTPYTGDLNGTFSCKSFNKTAPALMNRRITITGNTMTVAAYQDGTDAGGTYEGTFSYNAVTGTLSAELASVTRDESGGVTVSEPKKIMGVLYEFYGFVHFICLSSEMRDISPDDPLPLTFLPPAPEFGPAQN